MAGIVILYFLIALGFMVNEILVLRKLRYVKTSDLFETLWWVAWPIYVVVEGLDKFFKLLLKFINK
ncbi:hypothetical protein [Vibrio phage vB_VpaP_SJSY21]|nr:hypothetical protein [Vibrio phage vB_VpaP_SJSY21]